MDLLKELYARCAKCYCPCRHLRCTDVLVKYRPDGQSLVATIRMNGVYVFA